MKISTKHFEEMTIQPEDIITFPQGIPAFDNMTKYILIPASEGETPFYFLQSTEDALLCFLVLDTFTFFPQYDIEIDELTIEELKLQPEHVSVFSIVTANNGLKNATTNLKAPIILNTKDNLAKQVVLEKGNYQIKQSLIIANQEEDRKVNG